MFASLPPTTSDLIRWDWSAFAPYYQDLQNRPFSEGNIDFWLKDWSLVYSCVDELLSRLVVQMTGDTTDSEVETRYNAFLDGIYPQWMEAENHLKEKLLASGLQPEGFATALRSIRTQTDLFRQENLPLHSEEEKTKTEYDKITGTQTVIWEGEERTISQMTPVLQETDRVKREAAWRLMADRQLADRAAIDQVWGKLLSLREKIAANAGRPGYRAYRWQEMDRFDYTPDDARRFQNAIEEVVVPAASRLLEKRRQRLGVATLRPWDLDVDPLSRPSLRPFSDIDSYKTRTAQIFHNVHPQLGNHFDVMIREGLLDLENRKNKAPGGYCTTFQVARRPFIFLNAVGVHDDVQGLLHEGGHAFHVFESAFIPYVQQLNPPMEFAEVASMSMELLAAPYLTRENGGFYTSTEAARARIEHLETLVRFWPYMAVVDAFQHWVYENLQAARSPQNCDACWMELWQRFMPGVDWSGLEEECATGWQRKVHIFTDPFYYIEYGIAQLGALQVWRNSMQDQRRAVEQYRRALSLGGSVPLPELFQAAGARFTFDSAALQDAVSLIEEEIDRLESVNE